MKTTILCLFALLLLGCEDEPKKITLTGRGFAEELHTAECEDFDRCGIAVNQTQCVVDRTDSYCALVPIMCEREYTILESDWLLCLGAMSLRPCQDVTDVVFPALCTTLDSIN